MLSVTKQAAISAAIHDLAVEVKTTADGYLPQRTPASAFLKLFEELGELVAAPHDPDEWADVFIMLLDLAYLYKVTPALIPAIVHKLGINAGSVFAGLESGVVAKRARDKDPPDQFTFEGGPHNGRMLPLFEAMMAATDTAAIDGSRYVRTSRAHFKWAKPRLKEDQA